MNFHGRMMNIPVDPETMRKSTEYTGDPVAGYKVGHRDARHAAAEIVNEADTQITTLKDDNTTYRVRIQELRDESATLARRLAEKIEWADQQGREHGERFAEIVADSEQRAKEAGIQVFEAGQEVGRMIVTSKDSREQLTTALETLEKVADGRDAFAKQLILLREKFVSIEQAIDLHGRGVADETFVESVLEDFKKTLELDVEKK
jgi:hypothetical protein